MGVATRDLVVDGLSAGEVVRVESERDAVDAIRDANESRRALLVSGGGTRIGVGDPPSRLDAVLDLSHFRGVVEYEPDDLVATVRAGTTLAELAAALNERRQRWPVEAGAPARTTVGGIVASAAFGPSRLRYFHPRDWVIGSRVVLGDGTPSRSGGKVVKNATGYDLTRLWSGSFGTLAAILELTLKLTSIPERTTTLRADVDLPSALAAATDLHRSALPIDALSVVSGDAARDTGARTEASLLVRIAGPTAAVRRIVRAVRERVKANDVANDIWERVATLPLEAKWAARASWPASRVPPLDLVGYSAVVYPANGTAFLLRGIDRETFRSVREALEAIDGCLVLERATAEYKQAVGAWGRPRLPLAIARSLKERFDPRLVLAPGRMPS